ncbi:hypothetical protein [Aureliella helgolandensis]|uniref:Uncharacterized protein n=1 Tax=Aureliella helgolandensis TaxID=2527968 RepID=A0A518G5I7_9BACT|nr:hypothetical protein [Aureliella helgolandensis]QDV23829.1 hypothetical protein Q31a_21340 [Aureliella helgolandensis]
MQFILWHSRKFLLAAFLLVGCLDSQGICQTAESLPQSEGPNAKSLLATLTTVLPLLEKKDFQTAVNHFALPPHLRPEDLDGLIERNELSAAGIEILREHATFGSAVEVFGEARGTAFAEKMGVAVADCYGFNHETEGGTGEVMAVWDGKRFKIVRLDDVGKMQVPQSDGTTPSIPSPKMAAEPQPSVEELSQQLPAYAAAVEAAPEDVSARANYATLLFKIGNTPAAWTELMTAYQQQPDHPGIRRGLEHVWNDFRRKAVFTVGMPPEGIEGLLGAPTQTREFDWGVRWVYGFLCIDFHDNKLHETIDLRGATEALFRPTETVSVTLDGRTWLCMDRSKDAHHTTALLFNPGENMANWREQFEVQRILDGTQLGSPPEVAERMIQQVKQAVSTAECKILTTEAESVMIAVKLPDGSPDNTQHQLIRLMWGPNDVHRIAYSIKTKELSEAMQKQWFGILSAAKLTPVNAP